MGNRAMPTIPRLLLSQDEIAFEFHEDTCTIRAYSQILDEACLPVGTGSIVEYEGFFDGMAPMAGIWWLRLDDHQRAILSSLAWDAEPQFSVDLGNYGNLYTDEAGLVVDTLWVHTVGGRIMLDFRIGPAKGIGRFGNRHTLG